MSERTKRSDYIEWAKTQSHAKFTLSASGIPHFPIADLGASMEDIEISGPSWYGYEPLQQAMAEKCGVSVDAVVAATGTSMANFMAMAAIIEPGDEVIIERPAYDPLVSAAGFLGAVVKRFDRRFEDGFRIDPREVEKQLSKRTKLIVFTNLHNPTSVFTDTQTLRQIGDIAREAGARVLIDEVYLEALFDKSPGSAFHLGSEFVTTCSLTKAYGLSGLRCGWILAEPELAKKIWRVNDLFGNIPAHSAERLSVVALDNLQKITDRAQALLDFNRPLLEAFLDSRNDLETIRPGVGTVVAPRLKSGKIEALCSLLLEKYETSIVPGRFFEMPDHFRIGISCDSENLKNGLERLAQALDEIKV